MKLVKFENTDCPSCDRAKLFLKGIGESDIVISKMPYLEADDAVLAGKLKEPLMSFPTFVVYDENDNEVVGMRLNGFDSGKTGALIELIEFVKNTRTF